ncbi:transcription-repair coupling factor [Oceanidesulfovibrio indonesiensis]|uniref:Transcription-repair-coupling factor n=1 Tax=Oceanidesulfovibrio indonesiensis TaxID=54767 RepID=A0A7M3MCS2_9BACT|nr:transcription-repair coupling factor [Oceanidesulfovibrio indonesiensis]TVM15860.1 transcription-repair coupling factor [Oceanidesulfovibrio indonesiensis]
MLPAELKEFVRTRRGVVRVLKSGAAGRAFVAQHLLESGASPVVVVRGAEDLAQVRAVLSLAGQSGGRRDAWIELPGYASTSPFAYDGRGGRERALWARRMAALYAMAQTDKPRGILLTVDNMLPKWPPRRVLESNTLDLVKGEELSTDIMLEQAVAWGYERVGMVTRPGELSRRGDILDVFCPSYEYPLRLEFFGDTLEDLRLFDPTTQRAVENLHEATLIPVTPSVADPELIQAARRRVEELEKGAILDASTAKAAQAALQDEPGAVHPGLFYEDACFLEEWLPKNRVFLLGATEVLDAVLEEALWSWELSIRERLGGADAFAEEEDDQGETVPAGGLRPIVTRNRAEARTLLESSGRVVFEELVMGIERDGVDLPERRVESFDELMAVLAGEHARADADRDRPWHALLALINELQATRRQTILTFSKEQARKKFLSLAEADGLKPRTAYAQGERGLFALVSDFRGGADLPWRQTVILGEDVIQPRAVGRPAPSRRDFVGLKTFDDLNPGDLLVHREYGLARFQGLVRLDLGDVGNDYLLLHYQGDDKLYLPVDRLGLVQRYKGPDGVAPSLDKLGGVGWMRTREKARKAVEKIAQDLVEMYAYRKIAKGYGYGPPNEMFREFEASFGFEETPDQERSINDVLADMEKDEPMDRLVCGDVGFGKTEVAMRAAFRAALDGRQVAVLCPTTVLAEQHFQNFRARMKEFPVNVAMLSRFVSRDSQRTIVQAAKRGQVDILIGTHRILSKDVQLPNLGLLVLDEEQRFGVKHKERLKAMKKQVDVLTLTATPIPRTLQLSLSGVRSLSVIETPPRDRKPVETAILNREPLMLKAILKNELERKGQVFWVHNRVQGLEAVRDFVVKLVPEARVGMAHGQMAERTLEETMHAFWHGELDVLVCTSIIESGLDFPRANTLVVDQAHMFGLGQLYQLRGRVGRSDRQAYAYFVTPDQERLSDVVRKRLRVIMDLDYLGAGFQVAMEDLRLRGAGNILGESQSGHIARIGLDLFLEMLEMEVARLKGGPVRQEIETELVIGFEANIPEDYIADAGERLTYYKSLSSARDEELRRDLKAEIRDRYGPLPTPLVNFLAVLELKAVCAALGVEKAELFESVVRLTFLTEGSPVAPDELVAWVAGRGGRARLAPPATLELRLEEKGDINSRLEDAGRQLGELLPKEKPVRAS